MKVVTYHRVSTADQRPELAREDLRAACAARRWEIAEEIEETGSGARSDRPGLARAMELVERGRVTGIVVWKLDRFGRSALDLLTLVERIKAAGGMFCATTQGLQVGGDGSTTGELVFQILSAVAQYERQVIRERTRLGLAGARGRGVVFGRPRRAALGPAEESRAREMRRTGASMSDVARALGVPRTSLGRLLRATK